MKSYTVRAVVVAIGMVILIGGNLLFGEWKLGSSSCWELRSQLKEIGAKKPFLAFGLGLSDAEKGVLDEMKVRQMEDYDNYGKLDKLKGEISDFVESMGNSRERSLIVGGIIERIVNDVQMAFEAEAAWVTIRALNANNKYDTPRWHTDGYFYLHDFVPGQAQYKVAMALKGAGTLFCDVAEETRRGFYEIQDRLITERADIIQAELVKFIERAVTAGKAKVYQGEKLVGMLFIVGEDKSAAVHSEPAINEDRLFLSIVPGSREQIRELEERWNGKRQICLKEDEEVRF